MAQRIIACDRSTSRSIDKTKRCICKERGCESFYRMVELPEEIKTDEVEAELKDGILEVALPKKAPKHKKKVNVK